jgi:hypothetical protein
MLEERAVVIVYYYLYIGNIRVYEIGESEIHQSVSAREGDSRYGSVRGQSGKSVVI